MSAGLAAVTEPAEEKQQVVLKYKFSEAPEARSRIVITIF